MRALRVVGVTGDGSVVLEDPGRRERYTVPADEQLRAAARGDVTRLGQIAIELESQLRPREIQARIRGGASVDEVAAAAGVPTQKIERFAYPVLLERSRTAELAQGAHPQRSDGPDSRTLGETVAHTFGLRGQDYNSAGWDSWKGEDGKWVIVLTWQTGRSDNAAHWAFQPGAHGGTVVPLDEHASDLVEGLPARPLRPLGAVVDMARDEQEYAPEPTAPARAVAGGHAPHPTDTRTGRGIAPEQRRSSLPPTRRVDTPTRRDDVRLPAASAPAAPRVEQDSSDITPEPADWTVTELAGPAAPHTSPASNAPDPAELPVADAAGSDGPDAQGAATGGSDSTGTDVASSVAPAAATSTPAAATAASAGVTATPAAPAPTSTPADVVAAPPAPAASAPADVSTGTSATDAPAPAAAATAPVAVGPAAAGSTTSPVASAGTVSPTAGSTTPAVSAEPAAGTAGTAENEAVDAAAESATTGSEDLGEPAGARRAGTASRRTKKGKPVMPSWDEVLLGVRGQR